MLLRTDSASAQALEMGKQIHPISLVDAALRVRRKPRYAAGDRSSKMATIAGWFAERQPQAVIIVDAMMNVFLMNSAARILLLRTNALTMANDKLVLRNERNRSELRRVLSGETDSIIFAIRMAGAAIPAQFSRLPIDDDVDLLFAMSVRSGTDLSHRQYLQKECLLTNAESAVALAIFSGLSLVKIAKQRGASLNTVKTQVRNIFSKCRVHSKVDLTRRLGEMLQVI